MSDLLDELITGKTEEPPRILLFGPEKIGKSTFAAGAPNPIFIQTEDGLGQIGAPRFPLAKTFEDVISQLTKVRLGVHSFFTLVIDSIDWLEKVIWAKVCKDSGVKSIEKAAGGYGKGYTEAATVMRSVLLENVESIRLERGMAIILIAHAKVEKIEEPGMSAYTKYVPKMHKEVYGLFNEWVDIIGFAQAKTRTEEDKAKEGRFIAHPLGKGGGERVLRVVGTPAYLAGNRYGITEDLPLSWDALANAMQPQPQAKTIPA